MGSDGGVNSFVRMTNDGGRRGGSWLGGRGRGNRKSFGLIQSSFVFHLLFISWAGFSDRRGDR